MHNQPRVEHFPLEALTHHGVGRILREDGFESDVDASQLAILHLINLAHASAGDETYYGEPAIDEVTGPELTGVVVRRRRRFRAKRRGRCQRFVGTFVDVVHLS